MSEKVNDRDRLLKRYYSGETSVDEEAELRRLLADGEQSERYAADRIMLLSMSAAEPELPAGFDESIKSRGKGARSQAPSSFGMGFVGCGCRSVDRCGRNVSAVAGGQSRRSYYPNNRQHALTPSTSIHGDQAGRDCVGSCRKRINESSDKDKQKCFQGIKT